MTLDVVQRGGVYTLDGFDDQCGAGDRGSATGTAALNGDGSVMIGLTLVTSPGATPMHVSVRLNPATLSGTWSDSGGLSGPFAFGPSSPAGGSPRPVSGLGLGAIDTAQVQRRVSGACPEGQAVRTVNQDGTVVCQAVVGTGGGTITGVTAGAGLTGGGTSGTVPLAVSFGGPGAAMSAARSDHTHAVGAAPLNNLAIGVDAMPASTGAGNTAVGRSSLYGNTSGANNTAVGVASLNSNTAGSENTAIGRSSLFNTQNPYGSGNTAVGYASMFANVSGSGNTAVGHSSLAMSTTGLNNTAIGAGTLSSLTTGRGNIAIGDNVGNGITGGVDNIRIGNHLPFDESRTIRLGGPGQFYTFIAGIREATTGNNDAVAVVIDSAGQLGTVSSSARFKEAVADLGDVAAALQRLRPVRFRYRQPFADGSKPVQYGLIAEEVEAVLPALVAYDDEGQPASVKYHVLPALLLAEVQRLERERAAQHAEIASLREELARLRARTLDHLSEPTAALERWLAACRR
ncbi:MAG: tail fiber domain-containing protein [Vicinamibacterales bacterium]